MFILNWLISFLQAKRAKLLDPLKDADLPLVPKGSLGNLRRGMQSLPNKVRQSSTKGFARLLNTLSADPRPLGSRESVAVAPPSERGKRRKGLRVRVPGGVQWRNQGMRD